MRQVVYHPEFFRLMDSWPLEFAVLVVGANGTAEKRVELTCFDSELSIEDLQIHNTNRLYHLVESAILAGELDVRIGPNLAPLDKPRVYNFQATENSGSCEVHCPEFAYTYIDVFDNEGSDKRPLTPPPFFDVNVRQGESRHISRQAYCDWVHRKGFHVPSNLTDQEPSYMDKRSGSHSKCHDVFLAHNFRDKTNVLAIARKLEREGVSYWIDVEKIAPGQWFQDEIELAIQNTRVAAIFVGKNGIGRWQRAEGRALIASCIERKMTVIPVLLPGVKEIPSELTFLRQLQYVEFGSLDDNAALKRLIWGIKQN